MSDCTVRLVSAGTGRSIPVPENITVAELRELADLSSDVSLHFNGEEVTDEAGTHLGNGDVVTAVPPKIGHGNS